MRITCFYCPKRKNCQLGCILLILYSLFCSTRPGANTAKNAQRQNEDKSQQEKENELNKQRKRL